MVEVEVLDDRTAVSPVLAEGSGQAGTAGRAASRGVDSGTGPRRTEHVPICAGPPL
ncbi:hypothetical protein [Streptosporangium carneum]|uniref:Uncharacterized protein n=1 Tax=Streptosporangium carneum TaxID=47481 RepID=A0A9W6I2M5_9ACTN|nr:hypothetical protein [Streptosporangium carneum]GLK10281.1 hypothetical protein GCM10017600_36870 [Streptosporangium carneum]